ncbi:DUF7925 domain-containing protein [Leptothoe spongobia]|uniref:DUF7925 domain-containing protein n=1 Tax=Leptothoe spongobia TAU-MAC 1115 TaxID=1967444 RepID=A0A947GG65_9CYAN|nr:hypothetical protein [Leptothoe spongobia]MBT9313993.1 hypothetical protein [Leptothoe spongobia TAU-MAC 1115]
MTKNKSSKRLGWQLCKPVVASALAIGGVFNLMGVVLADGTAAGTQISNTATATYRDPDGTPQTSTSNTVVVEVAEISGITVVNTSAQEFTPDADPPGPGEQLEFIFEVTNVGNDETDISLPAVADFTGPVDSVVSIRADLDGDGTYETDITNRTDVENIASGDSFDVQVIVQVSTSAQNDDIVSVQYGDTPGDGQNQSYDSSGGSIFTDDNDATDVANGTQTAAEAGPDAPANGEREASATGQVTIGEEPLEQPLVELKKSINDYSDQGNADPLDDTITYDLEFDVLDNNGVPVGSDAQAADLQPITLNGLTDRHVLVSDAIPDGTSLSTTPPTPATNWSVVYTSDPLTTSAIEATWSVNPAGATRVGFIGPANTAVPVGDTVTGFQITVITDQVDPTAAPITIANIAQVFGSGVVDDPLTPEDESLSFPVMDESGDDTPSNYDPATDTYSSFNPDVIDDPATPLPEGFTPDDGYIEDPTDLLEQGIDPGGDTPADPTDDNTGDNTDGDGEAIVVTLVPEPVSDLLNGPDGAPDAVGPTGTNDDFTNKSAPFSAGDPPVVEFTNTVDNAGNEDGWVRLEPITPDDPADLPAGTTATIIAPDGTRVEYTYDGASWDKTNLGDPDIIVPIRADDTVPGGDDEFDYGVEVDLPNDTVNITELDNFPVPIQATFAGVTDVQAEDVANGNDGIDTTDITNILDTSTTANITIDRVYTGFLELVKTAQVVRGDGPEVSGNPAPGNHIRYRITYRNISETEVAPMQGNVLLTASDLAILEDGTERACLAADPVNSNNWAFDNDVNGDLDTRHVQNSVDLTNLDDGSTGTVLFFNGGEVCDAGDLPAFNPDVATPTTELSGTSYNTDTTKYVFDIEGDVEPLETGYVEFERRIN